MKKLLQANDLEVLGLGEVEKCPRCHQNFKAGQEVEFVNERREPFTYLLLRIPYHVKCEYIQ